MVTIQRTPERKTDHLKEGRCPDHGIRMTQVARQYLDSSDQAHAVFACPRQNCAIRARAYTLHGPWILMPE